MHTYNYHAHEQALTSRDDGCCWRTVFYMFWSYSSIFLLLRYAQLLADFVAIGVNECCRWPSIHLFFLASEFIPLGLGICHIRCRLHFDGWAQGLNLRAAWLGLRLLAIHGWEKHVRRFLRRRELVTWGAKGLRFHRVVNFIQIYLFDMRLGMSTSLGCEHFVQPIHTLSQIM